MFDDELPRLILVSGRSDAGVRKTIKTVLYCIFNIDNCHNLIHNCYSKRVLDRKLQYR